MMKFKFLAYLTERRRRRVRVVESKLSLGAALQDDINRALAVDLLRIPQCAENASSVVLEQAHGNRVGVRSEW